MTAVTFWVMPNSQKLPGGNKEQEFPEVVVKICSLQQVSEQKPEHKLPTLFAQIRLIFRDGVWYQHFPVIISQVSVGAQPALANQAVKVENILEGCQGRSTIFGARDLHAGICGSEQSSTRMGRAVVWQPGCLPASLLGS